MRAGNGSSGSSGGWGRWGMGGTGMRGVGATGRDAVRRSIQGSRRLFPRCILPGHGTRCALPFLRGRGRSLRAPGFFLVLGLAVARVETGKEAHQGVGRSPGPAGLFPAAGKKGGAVRRHVRQAGNVLAAGHGLGRLFHRRAGEGRLRPGARAGTAALAGLRRDEGRFVRGHQTGLAQLAGDLVRADVPAQGADRDDGLHRSGYRFLLPGGRTVDRSADGHGLADPFTGMAQAGAHIATGKGTGGRLDRREGRSPRGRGGLCIGDRSFRALLFVDRGSRRDIGRGRSGSIRRLLLGQGLFPRHIGRR